MPESRVGGQLVGGRYVIGDAVEGERVWRGRDIDGDRDVAIHELDVPSALSPEADAILRQEVVDGVRAALGFRHPGALAVYDAFQEDGRVVVVTELVEGPTLAQAVAEDGPMSAEAAAAMALSLHRTLEAARGEGITSGTVSPEAVVVPAGGAPRLVGLGVGPAAPSSGDLTGLAATLYWAVEGRRPEEGELSFDSSGALAGLLERALGPDVTGRPSMQEVGLTLTDVAGPLAVPAETAFGPRRQAAPPTPPSDEDLASTMAEAGWAAPSDAPPAPPAEADALTDPEPAQPAEPRRGRRKRRRHHEEPEVATAPEQTDAGADTADWAAAFAAPSPPAESGTASNGEVAGSVAVDNAGDGEGGADGETPIRYRSTPSWPPPPKRNIPWSICCGLVLVVLLSLLITNGRVNTKDGKTTGTTRNAPELTASPDQVPRTWVAYRDPVANYGISYPPTWTLDVQGSLLRVRDAATGAELRLDHRSPPAKGTPERQWLDLEESFSSNYDNYRRLQLSPATFLGHEAALWEFTYSDGGDTLHAVDLGFVTGQYGFALYFQAPDAVWHEVLPTFGSFVNSFRDPSG